MQKRNSAVNISSLPIQKSTNSSLFSLAESSNNSNSNINLNISHGGTPINSYIMFEKSDESSNDDSLGSDSASL